MRAGSEKKDAAGVDDSLTLLIECISMTIICSRIEHHTGSRRGRVTSGLLHSDGLVEVIDTRLTRRLGETGIHPSSPVQSGLQRHVKRTHPDEVGDRRDEDVIPRREVRDSHVQREVPAGQGIGFAPTVVD